MKSRRKPLILLARKWAPLVAGGVALQINLSGCDTEVRDTVLTGLQTSLTGLVTSIINAFFLSLQDAGTTSQPVVNAIMEQVHHVQHFLA
ncbi:MAG TPA: hypothetical protein P5081_10180 [Phycisphaerae bacterium]|nr:hypothetical protein [Phycisphaerae bacterium]HRW53246.1 hypothetical protein [Phycisphaerae bacterium]